MSLLIPPPSSEPIAKPRDPNVPPGQTDPGEGIVSDTWNRWFVAQAQAVNTASVTATPPTSLTALGGAITTTSLVPALTAAGIYKLSYYARITTPGTVSSSLTVTLSWTDHAVGQSFTGAAMTGNTTTTWQALTFPAYVDAGLPVTYSTAYASVGATSMVYELYVLIEQIAI